MPNALAPSYGTEEVLTTNGVRNWRREVTGLGPVASNRKTGQSSSRTEHEGGGGGFYFVQYPKLVLKST
jgi:hypothetical protein